MDAILHAVLVFAQHHTVCIQALDVPIIQGLHRIHFTCLQAFPVFAFVHQKVDVVNLGYYGIISKKTRRLDNTWTIRVLIPFSRFQKKIVSH